jgi:hypothetical protein
MTSFVVTAINQTPLEGGKVGYGKVTMSSRHGSYETYAVRLSGKTASMVEIGDTLEYWRGKSDWCVVECGGQIIKSDGKKIQLTGSADIGIDTGHPPHLGLKMIQAPKMEWEVVDYSSILDVIVYLPTGEVFYQDGMCFPSSIEEARVRRNKFVEPEINFPYKGEYTWRGNPLYGFQSGYFCTLKKVIRLRDTDIPLIK